MEKTEMQKKGGDLGWFEEKTMIKDFTDAIKKHKKGDVFITNTEKFGWYVILKTHKSTKSEFKKIFKVISVACR